VPLQLVEFFKGIAARAAAADGVVTAAV